MRRSAIVTGEFENRQPGFIAEDGRLRPRRIVRCSDIHPARREALSGHLRVVARRASSFDRIAKADGIDVRRVANPELAVHKHVIAARDRSAKLALRFGQFFRHRGGILPRIEQTKDRVAVVIGKRMNFTVSHRARA